MATTEKCPKCEEQISTAMGALHNCREILVPPEIQNSCTWEADEDGIWYAACDRASQNLYCFTEGGPEGNGFKFCPFCGRPLVEVKSIPASE